MRNACQCMQYLCKPEAHVKVINNKPVEIKLEFGNNGFWREGKSGVPGEKSSDRSRDESQQQTQPMCDAESGNRTWATFGGRRVLTPLHHPCSLYTRGLRCTGHRCVLLLLIEYYAILTYMYKQIEFHLHTLLACLKWLCIFNSTDPSSFMMSDFNLMRSRDLGEHFECKFSITLLMNYCIIYYFVLTISF